MPMWFARDPGNPDPGIYAAAMLHEDVLKRLMQLREMERLGLLFLASEGNSKVWKLTEFGARVRMEYLNLLALGSYIRP